MKVLFVCWQNVSRSQMAAAYYNYFTGTHAADSAGTQVEHPGETLQERRKRVGGTVAVELMAQEGIDIASSPKTQLTPEMLNNYDYILAMASPDVTPAWLSSHPHYVYWPVADPGAVDLRQAAKALHDIKTKVQQFVADHPVS
jgi:protein-tyrosine-phosphatase